MQFGKKWFFPSILILCTALNCHAENLNIQNAIDDGVRYLESVQSDYGEFPTTFTPNIPDPERSLQASYDSNLFTTALVADALHSIQSPGVLRMQKKVVTFLQSQLHNQNGLWSYFSTHNPNPLYPNTIYDLDDTAFASIVLQQNNIHFPDNYAAIKANKNNEGLFLTFFLPPDKNNVDCGVNANVLSYMQENDPQICRYLNTEVAQGKNCATYYTLSDAYYLIARAYASGISCLKPTIPFITTYVLKQMNKEDGSVDDSPFKTAIALNTLISLGYHGSEIHHAKHYLLKTQSSINGSWPAEDFWLWAGKDNQGNPILLGRSSSRALTTALALKALNALRSES